MNQSSVDAMLERGSLLYRAHRYDEAIGNLKQCLLADPQNANGHALLSLCLCATDEHKMATEHAQSAIFADPEFPLGHYALANALFGRNRFVEAKAAIEQGIRLQPNSSAYFGLKSQILFSLPDWPGSLEAAEKGLQLDPDDESCANLRAMALRQLRRGTVAEESIRESLARDPNNSVSHANLGWSLLEQGKSKEALAQFQEALRLEPNSDYARHGLIHALRSRFIIYRWLFSYFSWVSKLGTKYSWAVVLGGYFGFRALFRLTEQFPQIAPLALPICFAYVAFAISTWLVTPLTNLLVMASGYGRHALPREQKFAALAVATCLFLGIAILALVISAQMSDHFLFLGLMIGLLSLPISGIEACENGWPKLTALGIVGVLGAIITVVGISLIARVGDGSAFCPRRELTSQDLISQLSDLKSMDEAGKRAKLQELTRLDRLDDARIEAWKTEIDNSWQMKLSFAFMVLCLLSQFAILGLQSARVRS